MKEEKEEKHVYGLKIYLSEGYEKLVPLTKKTSADLPPIKFKYYSLQKKKPERNRLLWLLWVPGKVWI